MQISVKLIGTATVLLEMGGLRFITDPVLGTAAVSAPVRVGRTDLVTYRRLRPPVFDPAELAECAACLLSHDQHGDHLDAEGRALLARLPLTLTTTAGAARLARSWPGIRVTGLVPWARVELPGPVGPSRARVRVTAVPAQHGPAVFHRIAGPVVGFVLEHPDFAHGAMLFSGDTRNTRSWQEVAERFRVGTAWVHLGAGRFWPTGPVRYSMDAREGVAFCGRFRTLRTALPVHFDDWSQFSEPAAAVRARFRLPHARTEWLPQGAWHALEV
ncbi:MAG: MBL fold metallo-hydrolase [Opitutae bacterium]|nr:MBL fold metallo-hydrolase [Opitutae bacterium]